MLQSAVIAVNSVLLTTGAALAQVPTTPLPPTPSTTTVIEATDFATDTFGNPWDYDNAEDAHTWAPAVHGGDATLAGGRLTLSLNGGGGYLPLIFPSFEGTTRHRRGGEEMRRIGAVADEVVIASGATVTALGLDVQRLAGDSRWATAAAVIRAPPMTEPVGALVASGEDFPDALAAGPADARATGP